MRVASEPCLKRPPPCSPLSPRSDGPGVMTLQTEGRLVPLLQKAGAMSGLSSGV